MADPDDARAYFLAALEYGVHPLVPITLDTLDAALPDLLDTPDPRGTRQIP